MTGLVLAAYDGSPPAGAAIEAAGALLPGATARVVHLWVPPFASAELRAAARRQAADLEEYITIVQRDGEAEAERIAADGERIARSAGWDAEARVVRAYGDEGVELAGLARDEGAAVLVVGSRGLSGVRAALGSVSDEVVHLSPVPVLVVPHLEDEVRAQLAQGPVVVGLDGSDGARAALAAARTIFGDRPVLAATAGDCGEVEADGAELIEVPIRGGGERAVGEALAAAAAERGASVIVVGSRGRSAATRMLLGSVALSVLHGCGRPVMVVRRPRAAA